MNNAVNNAAKKTVVIDAEQIEIGGRKAFFYEFAINNEGVGIRTLDTVINLDNIICGSIMIGVNGTKRGVTLFGVDGREYLWRPKVLDEHISLQDLLQFI